MNKKFVFAIIGIRGGSMVIDVITQIKSQNVDKTFSYHVPKELEQIVKIGSRVTIPFARQILEGFVVGFNRQETFDYELKDIIKVVDLKPVLNEELLELGNYISKKTLCTKTQAYQAMLPVALKAKNGFQINKKYETYLKLEMKDAITSSRKQQEIIALFDSHKKVSKKMATSISSSSVKTLLQKGILKEEKIEVYRTDLKEVKRDIPPVLNQEQQAVVDKVSKYYHTFQPFLLHGVTGSGKTEVYMHLIQDVLKEGKESIVLVPEISLTPQFVSTFKRRFGSTIAILHSGLSNAEKYDEWRKIVRGEVSIVIGARSAIFAPLTNIGMIIIDEEHSATYKQENIPHYHAIEIATRRAKHYQCPVVMGSATPSMESYTRAKLGVYQLLELKKRVNDNLPKVSLVDMKAEIKSGHPLFSRILEEKINDRLAKKEQIMILLNRRGYSTSLTCHKCGYIDKCPRCDIPLIYHKGEHQEKCHYCGFTKPLLRTCLACHSEDISQFGMGTQKLEEEIKKKFHARVLRMDVDTTTRKGSHEKMIRAFMNQEYDILIGTQMIAKGLDFPNVTLVGVLNSDTSLNQPDFRSAERTFQLLNQVAGRSGRGNKSGEVIMQGFNMEHYSIVKASTHDYIGYYDEELKMRSILHYPPFYNIALIKMSGRKLEQLQIEADKITKFLYRELKDYMILGPSSASQPKINNIYYIQIMIKYKNMKDIYKVLAFIYQKYRNNRNVDIDIDYNPIRL